MPSLVSEPPTVIPLLLLPASVVAPPTVIPLPFAVAVSAPVPASPSAFAPPSLAVPAASVEFLLPLVAEGPMFIPDAPPTDCEPSGKVVMPDSPPRFVVPPGLTLASQYTLKARMWYESFYL